MEIYLVLKLFKFLLEINYFDKNTPQHPLDTRINTPSNDQSTHQSSISQFEILKEKEVWSDLCWKYCSSY